MEIAHMEKVERKKGIASTVKADEFIPQYSEGVEKFLRDNQSMGGWMGPKCWKQVIYF